MYFKMLSFMIYYATRLLLAKGQAACLATCSSVTASASSQCTGSTVQIYTCICGIEQQYVDCIVSACGDNSPAADGARQGRDIDCAIAGITVTDTPAQATSLEQVTTNSPTQATSLEQVSSESIVSISSEVAAQTRTGDGNPNAIATATVLPNDPRIKYDPANAWVSTNSGSSVGTCNNGTKATQDEGAKFTFVFKGTDISLYIVPSSQGGPFSVQIDGDPAESLNSTHGGGVASDQCIPSPIFMKGNLADQAHQLTVKNGDLTAGTLELNSIVYTGKGAFGAQISLASSSRRRSSMSVALVVISIIGAAALLA